MFSLFERTEKKKNPLKDNFCQSLTSDSCQNVAGYEGRMLARFGPGPPGTKNNWRCYGEFKETNEQKACLDENGEKSVENCSDPDPIPQTFCYNGRLQEIIKEIRDGACPEVLEVAKENEESTTVITTTETEEIIVRITLNEEKTFIAQRYSQFLGDKFGNSDS